jgi:hypothetical protein
MEAFFIVTKTALRDGVTIFSGQLTIPEMIRRPGFAVPHEVVAPEEGAVQSRG